MNRYRLPGPDPIGELAHTRTLGVLELTSIARGWAAIDAMVKAAPLTVIDATAAQPGKFLIVVTGGVAAIEAAVAVGVRESGRSLFDSVVIPNLSPEVPAAINRTVAVEADDTIAVIESFSAVSAIAAADSALKHGAVSLDSITLLDGIGGKAVVLLAGIRADVESAVAAARAAIPDQMFVETTVISEFSVELSALLPGRR